MTWNDDCEAMPIVDDGGLAAESVALPEDRQAKLAALRGLIENPKALEPEPDDWIEMPDTFENGETLHWRRKPKGKPVCYGRESSFDAA